ncbi:MAG TPA: ABC transporter ATP-binding protein [Deltaproteobacteria bacterium]|nr:ABC transporter ATP-binding protein [Deltaproteobacteria bacterium]
MLSIAGLSKSFEDLDVLDGFSLDVKRNGFTVLIGPSGCGKSTLFDVLTGIVPKDAGRIDWRGKELPNLSSAAAYMQQKDLLLPWLTLMDNALLPEKIAGRENEKVHTRALKLFDRLGLQGFEEYRPHQVSGGMRQRCALVRTLMFEHELVLLDEPLSALDAITRTSLQALLLMLQKDFNKTLLMITHDVEEALLLADELLILSRAPMRIMQRIVLNHPKPRRISDPQLMEYKEKILSHLQEDMRDGSY